MPAAASSAPLRAAPRAPATSGCCPAPRPPQGGSLQRRALLRGVLLGTRARKAAGGGLGGINSRPSQESPCGSSLGCSGLAWPWVPVQLPPADKAGGSGWGNFIEKHWEGCLGAGEGSFVVLGCSLEVPQPHVSRVLSMLSDQEMHPRDQTPGRVFLLLLTLQLLPTSRTAGCSAPADRGGLCHPRPSAGPL